MLFISVSYLIFWTFSLLTPASNIPYWSNHYDTQYPEYWAHYLRHLTPTSGDRSLLSFPYSLDAILAELSLAASSDFSPKEITMTSIKSIAHTIAIDSEAHVWTPPDRRRHRDD